MSLPAIAAPGHEREPAPKERCDVLEEGFSVYRSEGEVGGSSQRSGLKVAASGPQ